MTHRRLLVATAITTMMMALATVGACSQNSPPTDAGSDAAVDVSSDLSTTEAAVDVGVDADSGCPSSTDYTSDSKNCGSCGHDCLGGACVSSQCQPLIITDAGEQQPVSIAVDETGAYWANTGTEGYGAPSGQIRYWANGASAPVSLATGQRTTNGMALGSSAFFFQNIGDYSSSHIALGNGQVLECPLTGCPSTPTLLADAGLSGAWPFSTMAQNSTDYFWRQNDSTVFRAPLDGGGGSAFLTATPQSMVADASFLYWVIPGTSGGVWKKSLGGGNPQQLVDAATSGAVTSIAVNASALYATQGAGPYAIKSCALPDCFGGLQPLATATDGGAYSMIGAALAADDKSLYWLDPTYAQATASLLTCKSPSCTATPVIATPNGACSSAVIGMSDKVVYLLCSNGISASTIARLAR